MIELTPRERAALRARAHPLHPFVSIGQHGLTDAVLREIDVALKAHELIKVRVHSEERAARAAMLDAIAAALSAAPVQHLGKLLVLWRPRPPEQEVAQARPSAKAVKTAKSAKRTKAGKTTKVRKTTTTTELRTRPAAAPTPKRKPTARRDRGSVDVPSAPGRAPGGSESRGVPASRRRRGYRGRNAG